MSNPDFFCEDTANQMPKTLIVVNFTDNEIEKPHANQNICRPVYSNLLSLELNPK